MSTTHREGIAWFLVLSHSCVQNKKQNGVSLSPGSEGDTVSGHVVAYVCCSLAKSLTPKAALRLYIQHLWCTRNSRQCHRTTPSTNR